MSSEASRQYEIIVYGATGYTGKYTAEHLHTTAPSDLKWAIGGRNAQKLQGILDELKQANPSKALPAIETINHDQAGLDSLARKTKVLISTVGPFALYGTPVVEACVKAGTHYLDVTGEVPWVYHIIKDYHDKSSKDGTTLIPQCGVESAPSDVLAYSLVSYAQKHFHEGLDECINSTQAINNSLSGGTMATATSLMDIYSPLELARTMQPFSLAAQKPSSVQTKSVGGGGILSGILGYVTVPELGRLTDWPFNTCDRAIVHRSWSLHPSDASNANDSNKLYGPNFKFGHLKSAPNTLAAIVQGTLMRLLPLALLLPPARWLMRRLAHQPGAGPSRTQTQRMFVRYKALGTTESGRRVVADLVLKGSMYYWTGVFVAEAAMELARGEGSLAARSGGVMTPSTLEQGYLNRLAKAGVDIQVKSLL